DPAAKLVDVGERLASAFDEAVRLRKELVLDADARDASLLELRNEPADVVEVPVTRVAIEEDRDRRRIRHELEHLEDLSPARFIAVANAELRRQREAASPDALEAGLLDDAGAQAVVRLEEKLEPIGIEEISETSRFRLRRRSARAIGRSGLRRWLGDIHGVRIVIPSPARAVERCARPRIERGRGYHESGGRGVGRNAAPKPRARPAEAVVRERRPSASRAGTSCTLPPSRRLEGS